MQGKYYSIVELLATRLHISSLQALDIFYNSDKEYDEILKKNFFDKIKYKDGDFVIELSPMHFLHGRCCEFSCTAGVQQSNC